MQATFGNRYALQSLYSVTDTPPDKNVIVCNIEYFELKHYIYESTQNTWVKKPSGPQPTQSCTSKRHAHARPPDGCANIGCFKRVLNKSRLQMSANGNKLDIIGAMALRVSTSASHGNPEICQIVYICRDTNDYFLSRGACVDLGMV